ncbi:hypothetical protein KC952_04175 [Candidatus Saccharibacteria bacterium]|nr:hypothetical protein [Candidatus Saccharibacteria bacterium]
MASTETLARVSQAELSAFMRSATGESDNPSPEPDVPSEPDAGASKPDVTPKQKPSGGERVSQAELSAFMRSATGESDNVPPKSDAGASKPVVLPVSDVPSEADAIHERSYDAERWVRLKRFRTAVVRLIRDQLEDIMLSHGFDPNGSRLPDPIVRKIRRMNEDTISGVANPTDTLAYSDKDILDMSHDESDLDLIPKYALDKMRHKLDVNWSHMSGDENDTYFVHAEQGDNSIINVVPVNGTPVDRWVDCDSVGRSIKELVGLGVYPMGLEDKLEAELRASGDNSVAGALTRRVYLNEHNYYDLGIIFVSKDSGVLIIREDGTIQRYVSKGDEPYVETDVFIGSSDKSLGSRANSILAVSTEVLEMNDELIRSIWENNRGADLADALIAHTTDKSGTVVEMRDAEVKKD